MVLTIPGFPRLSFKPPHVIFIRSGDRNVAKVKLQTTLNEVHAEAAEQFYLLTSGFLTGKPDWYEQG